MIKRIKLINYYLLNIGHNSIQHFLKGFYFILFINSAHFDVEVFRYFDSQSSMLIRLNAPEPTYLE